MNNSTEQLEQLEVTLEQAKAAKSLKDSIFKLQENIDFKRVVNEGYFEKEASRLVLLKADDNMQGLDEQAMIIRQIDAIGTFRQHLGTIVALGRMAEKSITDDENTREEILSEDLINE